ncbi:hypothetical protein ACROYT_G003680 [Oculina patagonica]
MDRAKCIPSTTAQRQNENQRVINDLLKANGYPESFIKSADESNKTNTQPRTQENPKAYTSILYVKGVSERVRRIFSRENIKTTRVLLVFFKSAYGYYIEEQMLCFFKYHAKVIGETIVFAALAFALIVALVIFVAYFKVFRFVTHHNHAVASNLQQQSTSHTEEAKITKTLVIVVLGFVFCWAPVIVIQLIDMIAYSQFRMPNFVFLLQTICIFASSAINPVIYGFTNKRLKKQYVELLGVLCPSAPQVAPVGNGSS